MISLDLAQRLSGAGLEPKCQNGYCLIYRYFNCGYKLHLISDWTTDDVRDIDLPALELEHLVKEIEKFEVGWSIEKAGDEYFCYLYQNGKYLIKIENDSPEESMGEALLWLLEGINWVIISNEGFWNDDEGWVETVEAATIFFLRKYNLPVVNNYRWEKVDLSKLEKFQPFIRAYGSTKISEFNFAGTEEREGHLVYLYKHKLDEASEEALLRILEIGEQDELYDTKGKENWCQNKFQPLINVIGREKASEYMYMGIAHGIYLYKHVETRKYINITTEGQFYSYNWKDGYLPIETPISIVKEMRTFD